jgi:hypothetical protein
MKFDNTASVDGANNPDGHSNGTTSTVKNGIAKETNGVSTNGAVHNGHLGEDFFGHDRQEVTRLMIQALNDLGYTYTLFLLVTLVMLQTRCPTSLASARNQAMSLSFAKPSCLEIGRK